MQQQVMRQAMCFYPLLLVRNILKAVQIIISIRNKPGKPNSARARKYVLCVSLPGMSGW